MAQRCGETVNAISTAFEFAILGNLRHSVLASGHGLLAEGEASHRVDAVEIRRFHAGAPLELRIADPVERRVVLGADLLAGQRPQAVVPTGPGRAARSLGAWTLVGCTVAPGFDFAGFDMAPEGWEPERAGM